MSRQFSDDDRAQLNSRGISVAEAEWQLEVLGGSLPTRALVRACSLGDGVCQLGSSALDEALGAYERGRQAGRITKFVPASGAASRMFECLRWYGAQLDNGDDDVQSLLSGEDAHAVACRQVFRQLRDLAVSDDIAAEIARGGESFDDVCKVGRWSAVVDAALGADRLNLAAIPKGLVKFHRSPGGARTAFEEHLVEAVLLVADATGSCRAEFTILPEHQDGFSRELASVRSRIESEYGVSLTVEFSYQANSTMTVALSASGEPFHKGDGRLLLRPGGHGALIKNLDGTRHDVLFVSNIDNIVPDRLKEVVVHWKKVLLGHLLLLQEKTFSALKLLQGIDVTDDQLESIGNLVRGDLSGALGADFDGLPSAARQARLVEALDRPIRVCGVVKNEGEPGGGPFWVVGADGLVRPQIVESSEVDPSDETQRAIFSSASHFNPVSIACGLRNADDEPYDLDRFVDQSAVFIAKKSHEGRELRALERPGLWNGAMSGWTTVFVEVPAKTFNPVKTIGDLLRESHR